MFEPQEGEPRIVLADGTPMPLIGAGAQYGFSEDGRDRGRHELAPDYVERALRAGLRLLDTARCYGTEPHVMRGIEQSGLERGDVFVISKAWPGLDHEPGRESSAAAIRESALRLGGYVDLYLVHHPVQGWQELWRSLEEAKDQGLVRAIGVSNFRREALDELQSIARIAPVANQIHLHPFIREDQADTLQCCAERGIAIIGYPRAPWSTGEGTVVDSIARNHGVTRVQVMLRWGVEHGFAVIPLSTDSQHLAENFAVREFRLTPEELLALDEVGNPARVHYHVDELSCDRVAGWAFGEGLASIRVLVDGEPVGEAQRGLERPDVQQAYPRKAGALESGFEFRFGPDAFGEPGGDVALAFEFSDGEPVVSAGQAVA